LWEGAISFCLILIPVRLYKATDERRPGFHLVREKDLCPITYTRVCKYTGEEVLKNYSNVCRGRRKKQGAYESDCVIEDDGCVKGALFSIQLLNGHFYDLYNFNAEIF
jgi:non-homologous end joining protein Ku